MRIRREDVEYIREHSRIDEVVGQHVALKSAGIGSLKGLCPFHDEKSPSFNVRPALGRWHCFGCTEGGDVISFVQRIDHLGFTEAVERLATALGYQLQYEDDDGKGAAPRRDQVGQRQRLVEANRAAADFYAEQLGGSPDALAGRQYLSDRDFDREAAARFGVGFAPRSGEALMRHLRGRGFSEEELVTAGLVGRGQRGLYDRFRGRLVWPIRELAGEIVGFGARRLFDDDRIEAKYLNTPETPLYRKAQVLYGLDLAKKAVVRDRQVVVVEGYTDVMACHLSGVETAVATCGTSFGSDHIRILRRLLGDDDRRGQAEVIFTFDGDAAGQKAARRAFEEDQKFVGQTSIAVAADGMDPCELRQHRGPDAVRDLIASRQRLFEFVITATLAELDLDTPEGQVAGLRATVPMVAGIRDVDLRGRYVSVLAGKLGMELEAVGREVGRQRRAARAAAAGGPGTGSDRPDGGPWASAPAPAALPAPRRPDPRDPVARIEQEALECLIQVPHLVAAQEADALGDEAFEVPAYRAVHNAIRAAGGLAAARTMSPTAWAQAVQEAAPEAVVALVGELAVAPLPADTDERLARYATEIVLRVAEVELTRLVGILHSRSQRSPADLELFAELVAAEQRLKSLRERRLNT